MASLAHFKNTNPYSGDVIYKNIYVAKFNDEYLSENCFKINKKHFHFNVNIINNKASPLQIIFNYIENKSKINLPIELYNKTGDLIQIISLQNFQFLKIKNLLDFKWGGKESIIKIKVSYKYKNMKLFNNYSEYNQFLRKLKLEKINEL